MLTPIIILVQSLLEAEGFSLAENTLAILPFGSVTTISPEGLAPF